MLAWVGDSLCDWVRYPSVRVFTTSESATLLTRLETRTKESNMYASHWVLKPIGVMRVNCCGILL